MESVRACLGMTGFDPGLSKASPPPSSTRGTGNQQAASAASLRAPVTPPGAPVARSYGSGTESSAIWLSVMTVFIFAPRSPDRIARRVGLLARPGLRHSKLLLLILKLALKPYPGSRISDSRMCGCFLGINFLKLRYRKYVFELSFIFTYHQIFELSHVVYDSINVTNVFLQV